MLRKRPAVDFRQSGSTDRCRLWRFHLELDASYWNDEFPRKQTNPDHQLELSMTQAIECHFPRKKDVKHVETYKLDAFQSSTYLFTIHQSLICQHGICYTPPGLPWETILFLVTKWLASSFWSIYQTARSALSMSSTWQRAETLVEATCWILPLKSNIYSLPKMTPCL